MRHHLLIVRELKASMEKRNRKWIRKSWCPWDHRANPPACAAASPAALSPSAGLIPSRPALKPTSMRAPCARLKWRPPDPGMDALREGGSVRWCLSTRMVRSRGGVVGLMTMGCLAWLGLLRSCTALGWSYAVLSELVLLAELLASCSSRLVITTEPKS